MFILFSRLIRQDLVRISGLLEDYEGHMMFTHNLKLLEENKYLLAGRLVGMSLMQDGPGLGCLDPTLYDLICGLPCDVYDFDVTFITNEDFVKTVQQVLYSNFAFALHMLVHYHLCICDVCVVPQLLSVQYSNWHKNQPNTNCLNAFALN